MDKTKEDLLALISHDVKTPMNTIVGFAKLLHNTELNEKQKMYVDAILSSSETLLETCDEILEDNGYYA